MTLGSGLIGSRSTPAEQIECVGQLKAPADSGEAAARTENQRAYRHVSLGDLKPSSRRSTQVDANLGRAEKVVLLVELDELAVEAKGKKGTVSSARFGGHLSCGQKARTTPNGHGNPAPWQATQERAQRAWTSVELSDGHRAGEGVPCSTYQLQGRMDMCRDQLRARCAEGKGADTHVGPFRSSCCP